MWQECDLVTSAISCIDQASNHSGTKQCSDCPSERNVWNPTGDNVMIVVHCHNLKQIYNIQKKRKRPYSLMKLSEQDRMFQNFYALNWYKNCATPNALQLICCEWVCSKNCEVASTLLMHILGQVTPNFFRGTSNPAKSFFYFIWMCLFGGGVMLKAGFPLQFRPHAM